MGIEVSWRDIKKLLPPNCSLGQFLGALCHYIKTALGEEHMQRLLEVFSGNSFIREPIATKDMWDGVQSAHTKTLSCSFVLTTSSNRANVAIELRDMMEEIMECWQRTLALHLKIAAWHEDIRRLGQCQAWPLATSRLFSCHNRPYSRDWIRRASSRYQRFARSCNHWCASTRGMSFRIGWMLTLP